MLTFKIYLLFLFICLYVYMPYEFGYQQRPEGGFGFPGAVPVDSSRSLTVVVGNWLFFCWLASVSGHLLVGGGSLCLLHRLSVGIILSWICVRLMNAVTDSVRMYVCQSHIWRALIPLYHLLPLAYIFSIFLLSILHMSLRPEGRTW